MLQKFFLTVFVLGVSISSAQTVRFRTNVGDIDVDLLPRTTPLTVTNFLNYMNKGAYNNSIVHRSVPGFIWQGGGYKYENSTVSVIAENPSVRNEPGVSNTRGTIAMAKLGSSVNSATNQWFFNLDNSNASNLDKQNGGFTAFGRVSDSGSLDVMDKIAGFPVCSINATFSELPLFNCSGAITENFVLILSVGIVPSISANGVLSASGFGGAPLSARSYKASPSLASASPETMLTCHGWVLHQDGVRWASVRMSSIVRRARGSGSYARQL